MLRSIGRSIQIVLAYSYSCGVQNWMHKDGARAVAPRVGTPAGLCMGPTSISCTFGHNPGGPEDITIAFQHRPVH